MSEASAELSPQDRARDLAHESAGIERDSPTRKTYSALAGALKIMGLGSVNKMFEKGGADMGIDSLHPQERAGVNYAASEVIGIFRDFRKGIRDQVEPVAKEMGGTAEDSISVAERLYRRSDVEMDPARVTPEMIRQEYEAQLKTGNA